MIQRLGTPVNGLGTFQQRFQLSSEPAFATTAECGGDGTGESDWKLSDELASVHVACSANGIGASVAARYLRD